MRLKGKSWAIMALITNAFVWGVSWWPLRLIEQEGLHPLWATSGAFATVLATVTLYRPQLWRVLFSKSTSLGGLWLLAIASGITNVAFNWAVTVGDVVRVVLLFYLMPAWALLLARWLLKEKMSWQGLLRLGLAVAGVLLVLKRADSPWPVPQSLPDWLALTGGFTFALTNIFILKLDRSTDTERLFVMFAGGTLAAVGVATISTWIGSVTTQTQFSWPLLLGVAALGGFFLLGNLAMQYGASRLKSGTTSLVMLTEIIFASLSAVWLGAAVLEARVLWGALLIFSAALWAAMA